MKLAKNEKRTENIAFSQRNNKWQNSLISTLKSFNVALKIKSRLLEIIAVDKVHAYITLTVFKAVVCCYYLKLRLVKMCVMKSKLFTVIQFLYTHSLKNENFTFFSSMYRYFHSYYKFEIWNTLTTFEWTVICNNEQHKHYLNEKDEHKLNSWKCVLKHK